MLERPAMLADMVYLGLPHQKGEVNIHGALKPTGFTVEAYVNRVAYSVEEMSQIVPRCPDIVNLSKGVANGAALIAYPTAYAPE
jgi:hypothetical protein